MDIISDPETKCFTIIYEMPDLGGFVAVAYIHRQTYYEEVAGNIVEMDMRGKVTSEVKILGPYETEEAFWVECLAYNDVDIVEGSGEMPGRIDFKMMYNAVRFGYLGYKFPKSFPEDEIANVAQTADEVPDIVKTFLKKTFKLKEYDELYKELSGEGSAFPDTEKSASTIDTLEKEAHELKRRLAHLESSLEREKREKHGKYA